ncbi:hypothetical protein [Lentiprolixibacter aurantiacus]|uniref:Uncharacterized protein n=1 Tax=Lentiprolixibacter aurantiacus TaxID=2993939 RepID=A0AAE3SMZ2_9FLAO|nr:hypothetical protein [Lentiprolixibacter aurantiacus]MCX2719187.1 hypothetical protein [Lentiprolixibacter aurantiacus]
MRKNLHLILPIKLLLVLAFISLPNFSYSQSNADSDTKKLLNIGFVLYTQSNTPGTLFARWNYGNAYSGPGIATGGPKENGYVGNYHVRYFYENGDFSDEYDLVIEKKGDFYDVSWLIKGEVAAKGVGMEVDNGLAVGWRRVTD